MKPNMLAALAPRFWMDFHNHSAKSMSITNHIPVSARSRSASRPKASLSCWRTSVTDADSSSSTGGCRISPDLSTGNVRWNNSHVRNHVFYEFNSLLDSTQRASWQRLVVLRALTGPTTATIITQLCHSHTKIKFHHSSNKNQGNCPALLDNPLNKDVFERNHRAGACPAAHNVCSVIVAYVITCVTQRTGSRKLNFITARNQGKSWARNQVLPQRKFETTTLDEYWSYHARKLHMHGISHPILSRSI